MLAALVLLATLDTLTFTAPLLEPAEGRCDTSFGIPERGPLLVILERLRSTAFYWEVIDSLPGVIPGARGRFVVDLDGCHPCAFRTWLVDQAHNLALCAGNVCNRADSSSSSPVGVPPAPPGLPWPGTPLELRVYDLAGRRITRRLELLPSGWYALRWLQGGRVVARRDTVLIR